MSCLGVDLRALQPPAVIDVDRLPFGERVERSLPSFAHAVAGAARAAKRKLHFAADRAVVNVDDAGRQVADGAECAIDVLRENGTDEAVGHVVVDGDGFFELPTSMMHTTGPKISSRAMRIAGVTLSNTVGQ